jgi:hypothetical protein
MSKVFKFSIIFSCLSSQFLLLSSNAQVISQTSSSTSQSPPASNELLNGIIIAIFASIFTFLATLVIERLKKRVNLGSKFHIASSSRVEL